VVTGTHIAQLGFTSPSPVTVISAQSMQDLGLTNVGIAVNELPEFRADLTPETNGFANFNLAWLGVHRRCSDRREWQNYQGARRDS
jgi:iron complex outermembrane recepter protein